MSKTIAIANQKGGVAKTTTATIMAAGLTRSGFKVLLVDTDPQCNASDTFQARIEGVATLYDLLCEGCSVQDTIQHMVDGDIIASDPQLKKAEKLLTELGKEYLLRDALAPIINEYDYVIIDTPPALGILLINALTAANGVLVPTTADRYSLQGLSEFDQSIKTVRKYTNPNLYIQGLLLVKYNGRTLLTKGITDLLPQIAKMLTTQVYDARIRESIAAREAQARRMNLLEYDPKSTTAQDYLSLVKELLKKEV